MNSPRIFTGVLSCFSGISCSVSPVISNKVSSCISSKCSKNFPEVSPIFRHILESSFRNFFCSSCWDILYLRPFTGFPSKNLPASLWQVKTTNFSSRILHGVSTSFTWVFLPKFILDFLPEVFSLGVLRRISSGIPTEISLRGLPGISIWVPSGISSGFPPQSSFWNFSDYLRLFQGNLEDFCQYFYRNSFWNFSRGMLGEVSLGNRE